MLIIQQKMAQFSFFFIKQRVFQKLGKSFPRPFQKIARNYKATKRQFPTKMPLNEINDKDK